MTCYPHEATFSVDGTTCAIHTTRPEHLLPAVERAREELERHLSVLSLARPDSEVSRLARLAAVADITAPASDLLIEYLNAALWAARLTDGLVDPTIGSADDDDLEAHSSSWELIEVGDGWVHLPRGCRLDLRATAPAHAADVLASRLADEWGGGFLVNFGGDVSVSGEAPDGGWQIPVTDPSGRTLQVVSTATAAVARSCTWHRGRHRSAEASVVVDPRTGWAADPVWTQVTVASSTALEANAWATAAVVLGEVAPAWLTNRGVTARMERRTGTTRYVAGWPQAHLAVA